MHERVTCALHDLERVVLAVDEDLGLIGRALFQHLDHPLDRAELEVGVDQLDDARDTTLITAATCLAQEHVQDVFEGRLGRRLLVRHLQHRLRVGRESDEALLGQDVHRNGHSGMTLSERRVDRLLPALGVRVLATVDDVDGGTDSRLRKPADLERGLDGVATNSTRELVEHVLTANVAMTQLLGECACRSGNRKRIGGKAFKHGCLPA